jgi:hypothetical protein
MFREPHAKKVAKEQADVLATWQLQRDGYAELLSVASGFKGSAAADIMLSAGEALFYRLTGVALVEERQKKGHYEGVSTGFSIPVGSARGRSVRYRVGANRGHYEQGAPAPTAIDTGTAYITNKRVIVQGGNQTRECAFAKLIGFQHSADDGSTTFSVSNRQKPTTIHYGPDVAASFHFRLDLALAHFRGAVAEFVDQIQGDLASATRLCATQGDGRISDVVLHLDDAILARSEAAYDYHFTVRRAAPDGSWVPVDARTCGTAVSPPTRRHRRQLCRDRDYVVGRHS